MTALPQTGYLTITGENRERQTVTLNFPNNEVKNALHQYMLGGFAHRSHLDSQISALDLKDALAEGDLERLQLAVNALFASIATPPGRPSIKSGKKATPTRIPPPANPLPCSASGWAKKKGA